jgi:hypothetical protein
MQAFINRVLGKLFITKMSDIIGVWGKYMGSFKTSTPRQILLD